MEEKISPTNIELAVAKVTDHKSALRRAAEHADLPPEA